MSFDLTSFFNRQSQISASGQMQTGQMSSGRAENSQEVGNVSKAGNVAEDLHLTVGSTVSGQVVSVNGDVIQIEVAPQTVLSAKVEEGLNFLKGMTASFEVSSVSDSQIALRALFQNTAANMATINKAIDAAGLPQNGDAFSMVNAMMEEGMPIDKTSLQDMYRQVVANPTLSGEKIVAMNRLQIPVTEGNIQQFEAYLNLEHQISNSVEQIADSMSDSLKNLIGEGKMLEAANLIKQVMGALGQISGEEMMEPMPGGDSQVFAEGVLRLKTGMAMEGENPQSLEKLPKAGDMAEVPSFDVSQGVATGGEQVLEKSPVSASLEELMKAVQISDEPEGMTQELINELEKTGLSGERAEQFVRGELTGGELLDYTRELLVKISESPQHFSNQIKEHIQNLFADKEFSQAFRGELFEAWLMKPEDVADKQKINEFYTKLSEQTGKLRDSLQNLPAADRNLFNQITNIHNNIEFMNQLNQTAQYVQLPLKLAGETAHGDLYVYTNKKGLAKDDGNVSAFLHLDMEHLGPVDVYVAMQSQKVSTQFYLQDDAMLDFVNDHIHLLNERLEQKGYQMSVQMSVKEKPGNVMEEILQDRKESIRIGEYSFDMRA